MPAVTIQLPELAPLTPLMWALALGVVIVLITVCRLAITSRTATPAQQRHTVTLIESISDLLAVCLSLGWSRRRMRLKKRFRPTDPDEPRSPRRRGRRRPGTRRLAPP